MKNNLYLKYDEKEPDTVTVLGCFEDDTIDYLPDLPEEYVDSLPIYDDDTINA